MDTAILVRNLMVSRAQAPADLAMDEALATTTLGDGQKETSVRIWDPRARMIAAGRTVRDAMAIGEGRTMVPEIQAAREIRAAPARTDRRAKARRRAALAALRPVNPTIQAALVLKVVPARTDLKAKARHRVALAVLRPVNPTIRAAPVLRVARVLKADHRPVRPSDQYRTAENRTADFDAA